MLEDSFIPHEYLYLYKMSNREGFYYFGLTKNNAEKCIRQHYDKSIQDPTSKLYSIFKEDLKSMCMKTLEEKCFHNKKDDEVKFEILKTYVTHIGGEKPNIDPIRLDLDDLVKQHLEDPKCLNKLKTLFHDVRMKCRCGAFFLKSRYKKHLETIAHKEYEANNEITDSD